MLADMPTPSSRTSLHSQSSSGGGYNHVSTGGTNPNGIGPMQSLASMPSIVRPVGWEYLPDGGMTLVYHDDPPSLTVQEAFLPDAPPLIVPRLFKNLAGALPSPTLPTKLRTQSDLIKILSVFSAVVEVLAVAHSSGITHNNINTFSILVVCKEGGAVQGRLGGWHLASRLEREELGRGAGGAMLRGESGLPWTDAGRAD